MKNEIYLSKLISLSNLEYTCKEGGICVVDVSRRNQCQACRFSKCIKSNMRREGKCLYLLTNYVQYPSLRYNCCTEAYRHYCFCSPSFT